MKGLLEGQSVASVADSVGLPKRAVIMVEAKLEAQRQQGVLTASYLEGRKALLPKVLHCGLNLIANAFQHAADRRDEHGNASPLTLQEAKTVSDIISNIDNMVRLDAGDPTAIVDINRTIPATFKDIVAAFRKDPFIDTQILLEAIDHNKQQGTDDNVQHGNDGTHTRDDDAT